MSELTVWEKLKDPWPPNRIHWRLGSRKKGGSTGAMLAYIDDRDVMKRLDDVIGGENWQDDYFETPTGRLICRLSLRIGGEWITKSDGAGDTQVEGEKGAISDAFKRAAVKFGVGRYLYMLGTPWVELTNGYPPRNWKPDSLPKWAYPRFGDK